MICSPPKHTSQCINDVVPASVYRFVSAMRLDFPKEQEVLLAVILAKTVQTLADDFLIRLEGGSVKSTRRVHRCCQCKSCGY